VGTTTGEFTTRQRSEGALAARPVNPSRGVLRPLPIGDVTIDGGFWAERQHLNATTIVPHIESWVEEMGWVSNFDAAVEGRLPQDRTGRQFSDSDVYKLLEAMAWEIGRTDDVDMDRRFRALVERIAPVQEPDGYINTMYGRPGQPQRYTDFQEGHELYCFGHLIQAGVARGRTHGEDAFVAIARRAADHVCATFGADGIQAVCGHPEIEAALVEFSRYTGDPKYREQARLFIERRGRGTLGDIELGRDYFQDATPVREADVFVGHAVRALYLAAGAVDVAVESDDLELLSAVRRQLATSVARRTYLTGGMGARHEGESFGLDFELPSDRSYSETCAGVASVMLSHRMLLATGDAGYADLIERTLYNLVAASPAADGHSFFYANTLHQRVPGSVPDPDVPSPRAASSLRAPWFAVSCCPPNVARLFASLGGYIASVDDAGLQLHQYANSTIRTTLPNGQEVSAAVRTDYPRSGAIEVEVATDADAEWTLSMRVPAWAADGARLVVGGETRPVTAGYATVTRAFSAGETVRLELPVRPRWTWPDPRIDSLRGQVAVERGPIVMCLESVDAGVSVNEIEVNADNPPAERDGDVLVSLARRDARQEPWPFLSTPPVDEKTPNRELVPLVPYHSWANRGPSTMRVWLPVSGHAESGAGGDGTDGR